MHFISLSILLIKCHWRTRERRSLKNRKISNNNMAEARIMR
jgi:hypothetical protein